MGFFGKIAKELLTLAMSMGGAVLLCTLVARAVGQGKKELLAQAKTKAAAEAAAAQPKKRQARMIQSEGTMYTVERRPKKIAHYTTLSHRPTPLQLAPAPSLSTALVLHPGSLLSIACHTMDHNVTLHIS